MSADPERSFFDELLGSRRGSPPGDRLDALTPSAGARRQLERLLAQLERGDVDGILDELGSDHERIDRAPLLAELDRALARFIARRELARWNVNVTEFAWVCSLPEGVFGAGGEGCRVLAQWTEQRLRAGRARGLRASALQQFVVRAFAAALIDAGARYAHAHPKPIFERFSPEPRQMLAGAPLSVEDWRDAMSASFSDSLRSEPHCAEDRDLFAHAFRSSLYQTARARSEGRENHPAHGRYQARFHALLDPA